MNADEGQGSGLRAKAARPGDPRTSFVALVSFLGKNATMAWITVRVPPLQAEENSLV